MTDNAAPQINHSEKWYLYMSHNIRTLKPSLWKSYLAFTPWKVIPLCCSTTFLDIFITKISFNAVRM